LFTLPLSLIYLLVGTSLVWGRPPGKRQAGIKSIDAKAWQSLRRGSGIAPLEAIVGVPLLTWVVDCPIVPTRSPDLMAEERKEFELNH
jgi:hypothetical protein